MSETPWFRTAEGLVRLNVLKQFSFSFPAQHGRQRRFAKGEHLLDPQGAEDAAILAHPWIARDFADGHIESPQRTRDRLEADLAATDAVRKRQQLLLGETAAALGLAEART
jgi:hypothetical protein